MPASQITTYEVLVVDDDRWVLHARYRREEREQALEEARVAERDLNTDVKVVREIYNPADNSNEETTIYTSEKRVRKPAAPARAGYGGGGGGYAGRSSGGGGDWGGDSVPSGGSAVARRASGILQGARTRLVLILLGSLVGATIFTKMCEIGFDQMLWFQQHVSDPGPYLFMIWIGSFLLIAVPLALKKIRLDELTRRTPRGNAPPRPVRMRAPAPIRPAEDETEVAVEPEETPAAEADEPAAEEEAESEAKDAPNEGAGLAIELQRETMSKFAAGLIAEVQKARPQLDAYNRFGVSLMLAGAVDLVGDRSSLAPEQRRVLLADSLTEIGTKPDAAKTFSSKYEEYMVEKRYLGMVQAGRVAADSFLENPAVPLPPMKSLFDAWGRPQQQQAQPRVVAVMFTDMVGSTDMTQAKGDQAAQVIVRRHNSIVRAALAEYGGKQIKHTGDGIMAAFPSPASGVEASVAIQRAVAANNSRFPDQALHLRIGINAGEPIEEEEDLFGGMVQLAARVCAAAGKNQIYCSAVVKELSGGKGIKFLPLGPVNLKGFSETANLFEVAWS
jgi:class 3 adenylate cyclase